MGRSSPQCPQQGPTLLTLGAWTSTLQICEMINFHRVSRPASDTLLAQLEKTNILTTRSPSPSLVIVMASSLCPPSWWPSPRHPAGNQSYHLEGCRGNVLWVERPV